MADENIIDITHLRALKEHHHDVTAKNLRLKTLFVNVAEQLINQVIEKPEEEFQKLFETFISSEMKEEIKHKKLSLKNALTDLNVVSSVEMMVGLRPVIFSPGCTDANPVGWIAGFYMTECMFSSPELHTEVKARAFSILLFLRIREILKA